MSNADILVSTLVSELSNFYNSTTFSVIRFIIGIYVIVLIIDLVLLLFQRGVSEDLGGGHRLRNGNGAHPGKGDRLWKAGRSDPPGNPLRTGNPRNTPPPA